MSRREAPLRRGAASPLPQGPGIVGQVGTGKQLDQTASPVHLRASSPVRGGGVRCVRPAGVFVPPGRAAFHPAPGVPALERFPRQVVGGTCNRHETPIFDSIGMCYRGLALSSVHHVGFV